jgi:hypothetical protein
VGSGGPAPKKRIAPESGLEPHFHVTDATYEVAPDGTILVSCYEEIHGELRLLYFMTVTASTLAVMARKAQQIAGEAHNLAIFRDFKDDGGTGERH